MSGTSSFTANDIAQAMKAKAQDAFGEKVTAPVNVQNVQQHRAELTYTVTANYAFEYQSRYVSQATGPLYDQADMRAVLSHRQQQLLAAPGFLRDQTQAQLKSNVSRYREPGKFRILTDQNVYCGIEDCQGCAGHGTTQCSRCRGSALEPCDRCYRSLRLPCNVCNGNRRPGMPCNRCNDSGTIPCHICHSSGNITCRSCRAGKVTCATCKGACQLICEYHLDVFADTSVNFQWGAMSADWLLPALREVMNTPHRHQVFAVDRYQTTADQPNVFTASGHAVAAQAQVTYQQASGTCRFIGPNLHTVFLDGVLSGGFKKAVDGVQQYTNIWQVNQASNSKIARLLIKEMERETDVEKTSPVRNGIISAADATAFMDARNRSLYHIISTSLKFRLSAVLGLAFSLSAVMTVLYGAMSLLHRNTPSAMAGNEGYIGLFALAHNPDSVVSAFMLPLQSLINSVAQRGDYWPLACWGLVALVFNRMVLPLLAPKVWRWTEGHLLRAIVLAVPGILLLNLFMALHPSGYVVLRFTELMPDIRLTGALGRTTQWLITYVPQIFALSLVVALLRYKAAGMHWGRRQLRMLLQKRDVAGYLSLIK